MAGGVGVQLFGGPCDSSVSPSPFGLDFGTLDFGTSDLGLTIYKYVTSSSTKLTLTKLYCYYVTHEHVSLENMYILYSC